jgi:FMN phosphatase YigB (HAD superfamily)
MIHEFTRQQLDSLRVDAARPLIICDVDDVVVHFLRGFDAMLADMDHVLEANSFALNGNVVHRKTRQEMPGETVSKLVDDFFVARTEFLEAIDGAVDSLNALSDHATVVMLTNLPHHAKDKRIRNLQNHGLHFPVITNSGPKGPAIKDLESRTSGPVVFVDDSPNFVRSSFEFAPEVKIVHFLHDERFAKLHPPLDFVSHTTGDWPDAKRHIEALITG